MYQVFAAEVTGSDGDLVTAVDHYIEAALKSDDPAIAERATRVAFSANLWPAAAMAAGRWAELDPENLAAQESAALATLRMNDYAAAEWHLERILSLSGVNSEDAWADVTALLSGAPNPRRAGEVLERLLERLPAENPAEALLARSRLAARGGQLDIARRLGDAALAEAPERADLQVWAGRLDLSLGDMAAATEHFGAAHQLAPRDAEIGLAYAEMLARDRRYDQAQTVLDGLPDSPEMRATRVAYALRADEPERAQRVYEGFGDLPVAPDGSRAFHAGRAAELLQRPEEALEWYARIEEGPFVLDAYTRRAWLEAESGDLAEARNLLSAMRVQSDSDVVLESYLAEGEILRRHRRLAEAVTVLSEGIATLGERSELLYSRALVFVERGNIERAEQDLRRIIEAEPDNATAINALGYTLADRTDRLNEAEALIRRAYELDPSEPSIIDSMGWVAFRQGRYDEAVEFLESAWALENNPEIGAHLAEALWAAGQRERARNVLQDAQRVDPENAVLIDTLKRLGIDS